MVSKRTQELTSFIVMDVLEKANAMERDGAHIIHLEVGEPDFDAPACVKAAACRALEDGHTHYTHSMGNYELREAIAVYYRDTYGVRIQPEQIIVTSGSSPAILLVFSALLDPGDEVIISDPHYACYPNFIKFVQGVPVEVPVYEEDGFQYRPEEIRCRITARTKAIFINSPSNPTGNLLSEDRMREIAAMATGPNDPLIVSDEIYHGLTEGGRDRTVLEFTDKAFVLNGFSKAFAMTGWRIGWCTGPKEIVEKIAAEVMAKYKLKKLDYMVGTMIEIPRAAITADKLATESEFFSFGTNDLTQMGFGFSRDDIGSFLPAYLNKKILPDDPFATIDQAATPIRGSSAGSF